MLNKKKIETALKERAVEGRGGLKARAISEFNYSPELRKTLSKLNELSIHISGPSALGKTQAIVAFLKSLYGEDFLYIRSLEGLRDFDAIKHATILFDDVDVSKLSREERLGLLDRETPTHVRILYTSVEIPPETNRIFVSNKTAIDHLGPQKEVQRRIAALQLSGKDVLIKKEVKMVQKVKLEWDSGKSMEELTQIWRKQEEEKCGRKFQRLEEG